MTTHQAMIWLITLAIATMAILTIGTLAAAGLLGRENQARRPIPAPPLHSTREATGRDIVDVWSRDSFPASDPPANW